MVIIKMSRMNILLALTKLANPLITKKDAVVNKNPINKENVIAKIKSSFPGILKLIPTLKIRITLVIKNSILMLIKTQNPGGINFIVPVASRSFSSFIEKMLLIRCVFKYSKY